MRERWRRIERACLMVAAGALVLYVIGEVVMPVINCETQVCPYYSFWQALLLGCWCD